MIVCVYAMFSTPTIIHWKQEITSPAKPMRGYLVKILNGPKWN